MAHMKFTRRSVHSIPIVFVLTGCVVFLGLASIIGSGGGGGGGIIAPATDIGVFKDSNVYGIEYTSGDQSGITAADGSFTYEVGENVTFSVGGVTVGTASGQAVITPIDLVAGASSTTTQVQNIVRFLLMLDRDGDPSNGIRITAAVRAMAANWTQVDFTTNDLMNEVASIINDANAADGNMLHVLPSAMAAQAHLESTLLCTHAGAYTGLYSGSDNGAFGILVDAQTGLVSGVAVSSIFDDELIGLSGSVGIAFDNDANFIAGQTTDDARFQGSFSGVDDVSGTWNENGAAGGGTFDGSRIGGVADAEFRFTGIFSGDASGLFSFDIDANGDVTGIAYTAFAAGEGIVDETIGLTGTVNGTTLTAITDDNDGMITGTLDTTLGTLMGT